MQVSTLNGGMAQTTWSQIAATPKRADQLGPMKAPSTITKVTAATKNGPLVQTSPAPSSQEKTQDPSTYLEVSQKEADEVEKWVDQLKSTVSVGKVAAATKNKMPTQKPQELVLPTEIKGHGILSVRFSQLSITNQRKQLAAFPHPNNTPDCITLYDVIRKNNWDPKSKILIVRMPDGEFTSFDNRRLAVASAISEVSHSIIVKVDAYEHTKNLGKQFFKARFPHVQYLVDPRNKPIKFQTYGHAIEMRMTESSRLNQESYYTGTYGFDEMPWVSVGALPGTDMKVVQFYHDGEFYFENPQDDQTY